MQGQALSKAKAPLRRHERAPLSVAFLLQTFLPQDSIAQSRGERALGGALPFNSSHTLSRAPTPSVRSFSGGDLRSHPTLRNPSTDLSHDLGAGLFGRAGECRALEAVLHAVEEVGHLAARALQNMDTSSSMKRLLMAAKDNAPWVRHL
jgi:hypothetical protein